MPRLNRFWSYKLAFLSILTLTSSLISVVWAAPVTIDSFDVTGHNTTHTCVGGAGSQSSTHTASEALGGTRNVTLECFAGNNATIGIGVDEIDGNVSFSQESNARSFGTMFWDSSNDPSSINYNGLTGTDRNLVDGTNDGIYMEIVANDTAGLPIIFRAYAGSAAYYAESSIITPGNVDGDVVGYFLPFADFNAQGSFNLATDFQDVGAIELVFDGVAATVASTHASIQLVQASPELRDFGDFDENDYGAASHRLISGLRLGESVDGEGGTNHPGGDNFNDGVIRMPGAAEEAGTGPGHGGWTEGPVFFGDVFNGGSFEITIRGGSGHPQLFMDFNGDGTLEEVVLRTPSGNPLALPFGEGTHRVYFDIPTGTFNNPVNPISTRVRLSSTGGLSATDAESPGGNPASNGEVEDYIWVFGPTAITLQGITAAAAPLSRQVALIVMGMLFLTAVTVGHTRRRK